jgi:hypothetical protein
MAEPLHLRRYRAAAALCGAPAKSVRTTSREALVTCQRCLEALQADEDARRLRAAEDFVRRLREFKSEAPKL